MSVTITNIMSIETEIKRSGGGVGETSPSSQMNWQQMPLILVQPPLIPFFLNSFLIKVFACSRVFN